MAIIICPNKCKSEFQDKRYGKGKRVMNPIKSAWVVVETEDENGHISKSRELRDGGYRCTICVNETTNTY